MAFNIDVPALIAVLLLLATTALLGTAAAIAAHALAIHKITRARRALIGGLAVATLYAATLLSYSLASHDKVAVEKYFCEIDCHLAYSVVNVTSAPAIGNVSANGMFVVVSVRTRFDASTVSASRPRDLKLQPNPRIVEVVDEVERRFKPSQEGQAAWDAAHPTASFVRPLLPGEEYTTDLVFDLPGDVRGARLLVREKLAVSYLMIGSENAPFHAKRYLTLNRPEGVWRSSALPIGD